MTYHMEVTASVTTDLQQHTENSQITQLRNLTG